MVQPPRNPPDVPLDLDHHVVLFPTRPAAHVADRLTAQLTGSRAVETQAGVRARAISQLVVLEVTGGLSDVVQELDRALQLALAEGPRGVVCDLSAVLEGAAPGAVEVLAAAGRHVRDWSGIPVAVACPDWRVRAALAAHPLGGHLMVTASLFSAVSAVLAAPTLAVQCLRLAPHPTAARASREFVTRTLLDWGLGRAIRFASLVVSELVTSSMIKVGTDIDLSVAWNQGALRLTVRDSCPSPPSQRHSPLGLHERGLTVVAGLSRAFGILPTADGGKVVWAVLEAPHQRRSIPADIRPQS